MPGDERVLAAELLHRCPGRLRLRIASLRHAPAQLEAVAERARGLPGVVEARANPLTTTLLLRHSSQDAHAPELLRRLGVVLDEPSGTDELLTEVARQLAERQEDFRSATGLDLDGATLAFYTLLIIAIVQLARGNIMVPATTALWYAMSLVPSGSAAAHVDPASA